MCVFFFWHHYYLMMVVVPQVIDHLEIAVPIHFHLFVAIDKNMNIYRLLYPFYLELWFSSLIYHIHSRA